MADRLIIDTYNVLHVTGVLPPELAGPDAVRLAGLIRRSRWGGADVRLVCDGDSAKLTLPKELAAQSRIRLVFAGHGPDAADIMIERIIAEDSAPRTLLAVSSDRRILTAARKRRCPTLTSEQFLQRLADDAAVGGRGRGSAGGGAAGGASAAMWLREFGFAPSDRSDVGEGSASGGEGEDAELGALGLDAEELDMQRWVDGVERLDGEAPGGS
ncbi:MAG: NYN domain-containing protein [Phycisphaeraceae bacterium]|nr:NYN domain-containing protein [Phycisphaeraceae bacterium]MCB9848114.1 NYN domain-containing protein [Phycisphaeraceae bacterium]